MPTLYATNRTAGDGVQEQFEISFSGGYIDRDHVKAYIEDDTTLVRTAIAITSGMWVGPYTIDLGQSAPVGSTMVIYRDTPKDGPMVDFTNGSIITEANLDLIAKQGVFGVAEVSDAAGQSSSLIALDAMAQAQAAAVSAAASAAIALGAAGTAAAGAVYTFNGTGAQVLFTIPLPTLDPNVSVYINGVYQAKSTYAHASGALSSTITFSTAPLAGTGNIEVVVTVGVDQAVIDGVTTDAATASAAASAASGSAAAAAGSAAAADVSADAAAASAVAAEASSRLAVGTTTTGAPGSAAIVAISGSPGTQLLSLTIPRGDVGATGPTGPTGPAGADGAAGGVTSVNGRVGIVTGVQDTSGKDATGGYAGLTLFKLNLRNAANTITSWFTNAATVARTWTMPDKDGTVAMTSDITGGASAGSFTSITDAGVLTFTGTGNRITGDFSNVTIASRVLFQTSTANTSTTVHAIPNGTGTVARWSLSNASDPANASEASFAITATDTRFESTLRGTGSYLPITWYTSATERLRIGINGDVTVTSAALLGYGTGAGGSVTQATSKSTAVTLNKPTGAITTASDALASNAVAFFLVNNSLVSANDTVVVSLRSGDAAGGSYGVQVAAVQAGGFYIQIRNQSAGSRSEALAINFAVIKGATT